MCKSFSFFFEIFSQKIAILPFTKACLYAILVPYFGDFMLRFYFFSALVLFTCLKSQTIAAKSQKYKMAELELASGTKEGLSHAIELLEAHISDPNFRRRQTDERLQAYKLLLACYGKALDYKKQQALLLELIKDEAFSSYWIALKVELGESYLQSINLDSAIKLMKELLRTPKRRLSNDDAQAVSSLHAKIERHIDTSLDRAEKLFCDDKWLQAAELYQPIFDAACQQQLFRPLSKLDFAAFLDKLSLRLADCYMQAGEPERARKTLSRHNPKNDASYLLTAHIEACLNRYHEALAAYKKIEKPTDAVLLEACSIAKEPEDMAHFTEKLLQKHPKSPLLAEALFYEALLFLERNQPEIAEETLTFIKNSYPNCSRYDQVLYLLGHYHELATRFPDSLYAAESYYRIYKEELYAAGDIQAIGHLKKMPAPYKKTLFGALASFYVATNMLDEYPQSDLKVQQEVALLLEEAIKQANLIAGSLTPKMQEALMKKTAQAEYDLATCYVHLSNFASARACCQRVKEQSASDHALYHKASFLQSRALLLQGNESLAREELINLLDYARKTGFEESLELVCALIELAGHSAREGQIDEAFTLLEKAEKQAQGAHLLEIMIAKAELLRKLGSFDKAMMLLSCVINDECASALRIQAMYLRAELYEQKGRRDLAFRQLQTCAKKGGEWGVKAQKKLEEKYGY